jgi:hypothetical protein
MRVKIICWLALLASTSFAVDIPRKSPEFAIKMMDGKELLVSQYRGKVLCLVFILTT